MYELFKFLHFFGISIGAGTGIYMMAIAAHTRRHLDQAEARTIMPGMAGTISKVGMVGLALLIVSGIAMVLLTGSSDLSLAFEIKLVLVAAIVVFVTVMTRLAARMRRGDKAAVALNKRLAPLGPLLAVLTIAEAVVAFS